MGKKIDAKILIVDDEVHIVNFLYLTLESTISKVFKAYNGKEALEVFKENRDISVILSDIRMPEMDGLELIKNVRELDQEIPFIFFTGFGFEKYVDEALKYNAYDFINKPDLENVVEKVLKAIKESPKKK